MRAYPPDLKQKSIPYRRLGLIILLCAAVGVLLIYPWQLAGFAPRLPWPRFYQVSLDVTQVREIPPGVIFPGADDEQDQTDGHTVLFTAEVTGGVDIAPGLVCQRETWDFGDGGVFTTFVFCRPWWSGGRINRLNRIGHIYQEPGTYTVSFSYGPLKSGPLSITVGAKHTHQAKD